MRDDATLAIKQCMAIKQSLLFDWLYQHMKEGEDVATALHNAMLEMLDNGFGIKILGSIFSVWLAHSSPSPRDAGRHGSDLNMGECPRGLISTP
jgi:hypothetical protein